MKPMLAATLEDLRSIVYPIYASPKLDGVRGVVVAGQLLSRSLKPIPNSFVASRFSKKRMSGLDGELILGSPTAKDVYRQTVGSCSRHTGEPDVTFYVFDRWDSKKGYTERLDKMLLDVNEPDIVFVTQIEVKNEAELLAYETECLELGYEGLILRSLTGTYKFGRSTVREQGMMKLKRFTDSEFLLLDVEEEMENTNEAKTNALGRTERSTAQAGLVGKGRAGTLCGRDVHTSVEFRLGTGLDDESKAWFWKHRRRLIADGFVGKYKSFLIGVKDKPRFPVYLGPRERWDL